MQRRVRGHHPWSEYCRRRRRLRRRTPPGRAVAASSPRLVSAVAISLLPGEQVCVLPPQERPPTSSWGGEDTRLWMLQWSNSCRHQCVISRSSPQRVKWWLMATSGDDCNTGHTKRLNVSMSNDGWTIERTDHPSCERITLMNEISPQSNYKGIDSIAAPSTDSLLVVETPPSMATRSRCATVTVFHVSQQLVRVRARVMRPWNGGTSDGTLIVTITHHTSLKIKTFWYYAER